MPLFTFLMEFKGGTYLAQVRESSPRRALRRWLQTLDVDPITGMGAGTKREFLKWLPESGPVRVAGLQNAWCATFTSRSAHALVHFVRMDDRAE